MTHTPRTDTNPPLRMTLANLVRSALRSAPASAIAKQWRAHRAIRVVVLALGATVIAGSAARIYAQVKVAVVDLQRALNETEDGRRAKANLKKLFKQKQKIIDDKTVELKTLQDEIEKNKTVWSQDALRKKLEDYQQRFVQVQSTYVEYQRELGAKEVEFTQPILERMQRIIRRLGQAEGYTLITERSGVLWIPSNLDLTDNIIQRYNSGEGRDEATPPATGGGKAPAKTKAKRQ